MSALLARALTALLVAGAVLTGCGSGTESKDGRAQSPFGAVLSFHASGPGTVFAVTDAARTCPTCAALWRWQAPDGEWRRVHDFAEPARGAYDDGTGPFPPVQPDALVMAPDAIHGWFRWSNESTLQETADGGGSWHAAEVPWERADVVRLVVDAPEVYAVTESACGQEECGHELWRTRIGSAAWRLVDWPTGASGVDFGARGGALTLTDTEPGGVAGYRSTSRGDVWQAVSGPDSMDACRLEHGIAAPVVVCAPDPLAEQDRLFLRRAGGWEELRLPAPRHGGLRVTWVRSGDERSFIVGTDQGVVLTTAAGDLAAVTAPVRPDDHPDPGSFVDDRVGHLLVSGHRLLRTEDGGQSWTVIAGTSAP